jgi:L-aspartate oxidase
MGYSIKTDVLIIGSGIAGLFAALKISQFAEVVVVTKKEKTESNTNYAQGGIASVISSEDSFDKHIQDTMTAGSGLCNEKTVKIMVEEGPSRINDLIEIGTQFSLKDGNLELALEGGHSTPRIVHSKDLTGKEIESALVKKINSLNNIRVIENTLAIELITEHNISSLKLSVIQNRNCWGAYVLDTRSGKVMKILAKAILLATGGVGQVYQHTTNPKIATGDGIAMAYRSGARIANMEFIQFHPTSLYSSEKTSFGGQSFLISEAVRGFGGKLFTRGGVEFMSQYDKRRELAPRDIVARAIDSELKISGDEYVHLDISHKNSNEIKRRFPNIHEHCSTQGIDITKEPIPVVPAAHYSCGGIVVDEFSRSSLNGLYACGEVSMTGVHGANRLASNSLLEAVVFAHRAAENIKDFIKGNSLKLKDIPDWDESGTLSPDEKILITHSLKEVKTTMWDYVGIVRSNQRLTRAAKRIHNIYEEVEEFYKSIKVFPELLELRNLISCAHIIIKSALQRKESRGLHFTLDYPDLMPKAADSIIQNVIP